MRLAGLGTQACPSPKPLSGHDTFSVKTAQGRMTDEGLPTLCAILSALRAIAHLMRELRLPHTEEGHSAYTISLAQSRSQLMEVPGFEPTQTAPAPTLQISIEPTWKAAQQVMSGPP